MSMLRPGQLSRSSSAGPWESGPADTWCDGASLDTLPADTLPIEDRAVWITRRFFTLCEHPRTRERMLAAVRTSAGEAVAGRLLVGAVGRLLRASLGRSRRVDGSALTAELIAAQLAGIAVLRYVTEAEPVASMPVEDLVRRVAPAVRATLAG